MITLRPSHERGAANFGWLDSRHSFSFGNYYDPAHMGFSSLRVINEDKVAPSQGFSTHGHRDMEIVTYVLSGGLAHKDSIGNGSVIRHGDVQRMSAGTGIMHSEYNASSSEPVHLLQIWLLPDTQGLPPSYEEKHIPVGDTPGQLRLLGSRDGREGSVTIHQDVNLYAALLNDGDQIAHNLGPSRWAWLQVAHGALQVNDQTLTAGDAAGIVLTADLDITAQAEGTEFLLFDLAAA